MPVHHNVIAAAMGVLLLTPSCVQAGAESETVSEPLSPTPTVTPVPEVGGGTIFFEADDNGNNDIYAINANGSSVRRVATYPHHDEFLAWPPDGTQIAFMSSYSGRDDVHVMAIAGSDIRRLTDSPVGHDAPYD